MQPKVALWEKPPQKKPLRLQQKKSIKSCNKHYEGHRSLKRYDALFKKESL